MSGYRGRTTIMCARATKGPSYSGFTIDQIGAIMRDGLPTRPTKITSAEMRTAGVRGVLIYCSAYKCSHFTAINADQWPDHVRLSDLEARFVCKACGKKGADVRPDFNWNKNPVAAMGYR
jgi:hypothetical protein